MKVALKEIIRTDAQEQSPVLTEVSRMIFYTVATASALIGAWGLVGFIGGMIVEGGPLSLAGAWFHSVTGL
jgi:hypothetical protein